MSCHTDRLKYKTDIVAKNEWMVGNEVNNFLIENILLYFPDENPKYKMAFLYCWNTHSLNLTFFEIVWANRILSTTVILHLFITGLTILTVPKNIGAPVVAWRPISRLIMKWHLWQTFTWLIETGANVVQLKLSLPAYVQRYRTGVSRYRTEEGGIPT